MIKPIRRWLYSRLFDSHRSDNLHALVENFVATIILMNVATMAVEHVPEIYEPRAHWFHIFETGSLILFTVEYLLRLFVAPEDPEFARFRFPRLRYILSPYAAIDLLAILPFYLTAFFELDLRLLRVLRLLRLFKLLRVLIPAYHEFRELNRGRSFRQHVHALVWPSDFGGRLHHYFDVFIIVWVVISVFGVVLESVESVHYLLNVEFVILDSVSVAIFSAEYLMRMFSCVEEEKFNDPVRGRLRYAKTGGAAIDLAAIAPFFLEAFLHHLFDLRFLRIFRMMRLLKLTRFNDATQVVWQGMVREWPVILASLFVLILVVVMTASLGYLFEHNAQPDKFENIPQAIYWAVITLASVGYGDISPVTPLGRAFTVVMAILGIALVAIPSGILSAAFIDQLRIERETLLNELIQMMAKGDLQEKDFHLIEAEAKRLHVTKDEVTRLMEQARREQTHGGHGQELVNLGLAQRNPALAVQQFRVLVGLLRQVYEVSDQSKFMALISENQASTPLERDICRQVKAASEIGPMSSGTAGAV
jgi:voltage-gated potassium channel